MKNIYSKTLTLAFIFLALTLSAQNKSKIKNATVSEFKPPYEVLIIDYQNIEIPIKIGKKTKLKGKGGKIKAELLKPGVILKNIQYELVGSDRLAKVINTNINANGKIELSGLLESVEDDIAIIDGWKVKLKQGVGIKGSNNNKKCGCKGMAYAGLADPLLQPGKYFITITGSLKKEGYVEAESVEVCQNAFLDADRELIAAVENNFADNSAQNGILNEVIKEATVPMPLYNGEIVIGQYSYKLLDDIRKQGYINMVGERLIPEHQKNLDSSDPNKINFRFYLIDNPIPNAFAFPNGMIFVHTGILDIMENEAELAVVLGHEIAHVTHEHGRDRYETGVLTKLVMSTFSLTQDFISTRYPGVNTNALKHINNIATAITPAGIANVIKPQPKRESQADRVGLYYAYAAGYDIREAVGFWKKMSALSGSSSFQSRLMSDIQGLMTSSQFKLSNNPFETLTQQGKQLLANQLLNTIYTSHPKAKTRAHNLGRLLNDVYGDDDLDKYIMGASDFREYLGH